MCAAWFKPNSSISPWNYVIKTGNVATSHNQEQDIPHPLDPIATYLRIHELILISEFFLE